MKTHSNKRAQSTPQLPQLLACFCAGMMLSSCGAKEKAEEGAGVDMPLTAPFLTAGDLVAPDNMDELSKSEVSDELSDSSFLYDNRPEDSDESCVDRLLAGFTITATASEATLGRKLDITSCMQELMSKDSEAKVEVAVMSFYIKMSCVGADISSLNGKSFKEVSDSTVTEACTSGGVLSNLKLETKISSSSNGQTLSGNFNVTSYGGSDALGICDHVPDGSNWKINGTCLDVDRNVWENVVVNGQPSTALKNDFTKYSTSDLQEAKSGDNVWNSGGTVAATLNSWSGTVTFTSGSTAPAYNLKNGSQTVEGTVTASASLRLRLKKNSKFIGL